MDNLLNWLGCSITIVVLGVVYCTVYAFKSRTNNKYTTNNGYKLIINPDLKHLKQYKKYVTENASPDGMIPGYKVTATALKIKQDRTNMLRQYLIDDGYLKCEGKYTYLNK